MFGKEKTKYGEVHIVSGVSCFNIAVEINKLVLHKYVPENPCNSLVFSFNNEVVIHEPVFYADENQSITIKDEANFHKGVSFFSNTNSLIFDSTRCYFSVLGGPIICRENATYNSRWNFYKCGSIIIKGEYGTKIFNRIDVERITLDNSKVFFQGERVNANIYLEGCYSLVNFEQDSSFDGSITTNIPGHGSIVVSHAMLKCSEIGNDMAPLSSIISAEGKDDLSSLMSHNINACVIHSGRGVTEFNVHNLNANIFFPYDSGVVKFMPYGYTTTINGHIINNCINDAGDIEISTNCDFKGEIGTRDYSIGSLIVGADSRFDSNCYVSNVTLIPIALNLVFASNLCTQNPINFTQSRQNITLPSSSSTGDIDFNGYESNLILENKYEDQTFSSSIINSNAGASGTLTIRGGHVLTIANKVGISDNQKLDKITVELGNKVSFSFSVYTKSLEFTSFASDLNNASEIHFYDDFHISGGIIKVKPCSSIHFHQNVYFGDDVKIIYEKYAGFPEMEVGEVFFQGGNTYGTYEAEEVTLIG